MANKAGPFEKILIQGFKQNRFGPNTIDSAKWLRNKAKELGTSVKRGSLLKDDRSGYALRPGAMFFMNYDPKHKKTLPYYDRYPLFIYVGPAPGGFYGLNLHYLPLAQRAILMDNLFSYLTSTKFDDKTRIKLSYKLLKGSSTLKGFRPCFKHYLTSHIQLGPSFIHPVEWNITIFLPLSQFMKASEAKVYADSRKIMAGL